MCDVDRERARELLAESGGRVKLAIVMHALGVSREEAERRLAEKGGVIRRVVPDANVVFMGDLGWSTKRRPNSPGVIWRRCSAGALGRHDQASALARDPTSVRIAPSSDS